ncbi:MAG: holo-ACP synthase [Kyrpidia sp.]|nr:holo-ACP synthase [Kyrpidia sp.]
MVWPGGFSARPRKQYAARRDPVAAGRFAAKEAVAKALGTGIGSVGFRDIEIIGAEGGPNVRLARRVARAAEERGVMRWHLSISHGKDVAVAFAVAEGDPGAP